MVGQVVQVPLPSRLRMMPSQSLCALQRLACIKR